MKSCSFTGHRDIDESCISSLEALLSRAIDYVYNEGCRDFYCGGALGFDTMAAKLLINKRMALGDIRIVIVAPCINQSERWSERNKNIYNYLISNADEVIFISDEYTPVCMKKRNEYLAEVADVVIAYSGRERSGSAQTIRMAEKLGKRVFNLFGKY